MAGTVEFFQIYYKEEQKQVLYPFATPYFNPDLTPFFENSVIRDLVRATTAEKIGIASPELYKKIGSQIPLRVPFEKKHLETDYDVLSLNRRQRDHKMMWLLDYWHPGAREIFNMIWEGIGLQVPGEPKHAMYNNHFVARADLYKEYVEVVLSPAMELMESDPVIKARCYEDSQYYRLANNPELRARVQKFLNINYCPLHTFICERMFSCFINGKKLDVKYLPEIV